MRFQDKVCVVTGAGSGIGRATAEQMAREGGRVVLIARHRESLDEVAQGIRAAGGVAMPLAADVGELVDIENAVNQILGKWDKIDVLVNNAAQMRFAPVMETKPEDWEAVIRTNLTGVFHFCRLALPRMPRGGAIVNVSSVHAHQNEPNTASYAASKGGIEAFTRALSREVDARGIRVNCVAPGAVNTPMLWNNPEVKSGEEKIQGNVGEPRDLSAAICFLAAPEARFIQGTTLVVDGGRLDIL